MQRFADSRNGTRILQRDAATEENSILSFNPRFQPIGHGVHEAGREALEPGQLGVAAGFCFEDVMFALGNTLIA
ncbi:MAG TPA: hypothetical protein VIW07_03795 [Candidatus Udaeobacter sp.]